MNPAEIVEARFKSSCAVKEKTLAALKNDIVKAASILAAAIKSGHKLLTAGNGGSAADAQHMAAEFIGRFLIERPGLPAIALTTNTSALTCIVNDYPPETVFSRQMTALGNTGDVFIGFSTSGNSKNVVEAIKAAKAKGVKTIAITGEGGGAMGKAADITLAVPSKETPRIQEAHVLILHVICELVDNELVTK
jgi:D-sedoheptulose 7-phosphate isomerase